MDKEVPIVGENILLPHQVNPRSHGAGRRPGTPNKATNEARQAIALFVEGNVHRLQQWLDTIAEGYEISIINPKSGEYVRKLIPPNPALAYELFMGVVEYHVPKLTRSEVKQDLTIDGELAIRKYEFHSVPVVKNSS